MKTIFSIFSRDFRRLGRSFLVVIAMLGVCLIPSLYAWFNIAANMDPYGHTAGIRIGVANNDLGAENEKIGFVNAGERIVESLRENGDLGWVFCTEEEAVSAVEAGDFYAALVIPSDFSQSIISVLSGELKQPQIDYYLNEKKNAVAPKVTDSGASAIQEKINTAFLGIASETLTEMLQDSVFSFDRDLHDVQADLNAQLDGIVRLNEDFQKGWTDFQRSYERCAALIVQADGVLSSVDDVVAEGKTALSEGDALLTDSRQSMDSFSSSLDDALDAETKALRDFGERSADDLHELERHLRGVSRDLNEAADIFDAVLDRNEALLGKGRELMEMIPGSKLDETLARLESDNKRMQAELDDFRATANALSDSVGTLAGLSDSLFGTLSQTEQALQKSLDSMENDVSPELDRQLDSLSRSFATLDVCLDEAARMAGQTRSLLAGLQKNMDAANKALEVTAESMSGLSAQIERLQNDTNSLLSSRYYQEFLELGDMDAEAVADFVSAPIELREVRLFAVKNYGSGMTPFYSNLAFWVSGLVLLALFKLEVDRDESVPRFNATQAYFGRWMLFVVFAMIQALIVCLGDIWLLHVQCLHPLAFIGAGLLSVLVYVSLIFSLSIAFRHIGKAICVILVILQIPGSSGTFPVEMAPPFFRFIHPLLPFSYSIGAMREAVAGMYDNLYWHDLGCLLLFLPISFLIGLGIRPLLHDLNRMFDRHLAETGLVDCEEEEGGAEQKRPLRLIPGDQRTRVLLDRQASLFEGRYRRLLRLGAWLFLLLPLPLLILSFSLHEGKVLFLVLWIISVISLCVYIICVEYIHEKLQDRLQQSYLARQERAGAAASAENGGRGAAS